MDFLDFNINIPLTHINILFILIPVILIRLFVSGPKCTLTKDLTNHVIVITGSNTGIVFF